MLNKERTWELTNFCEIDKYAEKSYCAVHSVDPALNLGDITKVDASAVEPFTMICGGSPCQDFSIAGKQAGSMWKCSACGHEYNPLTVHYSRRDVCPMCGSSDLDKTRSSLLVEWLRMIRVNRPLWGIYENVKNLVGNKFKDTFQMFLDELHEYGYNTYYQVLNAKDYEIPQNRERVFLVLIRKEYDNGLFRFPDSIESDLTVYDFLEPEEDVPENYYVKGEKTDAMLQELIDSGKLDSEIAATIRGGRRTIDGKHTWDLIRV